MDFSLRVSFPQALEEMHVLAYCYHWGRDTLWEMSRKERKMWCKLVLKQKKFEAGSNDSDYEDDSTSSYIES